LGLEFSVTRSPLERLRRPLVTTAGTTA
jgi:hypothetical protein